MGQWTAPGWCPATPETVGDGPKGLLLVMCGVKRFLLAGYWGFPLVSEIGLWRVIVATWLCLVIVPVCIGCHMGFSVNSSWVVLWATWVGQRSVPRGFLMPLEGFWEQSLGSDLCHPGWLGTVHAKCLQPPKCVLGPHPGYARPPGSVWGSSRCMIVATPSLDAAQAVHGDIWEGVRTVIGW